MRDFMISLWRAVESGLRWAADHEPVRFGAAVQVVLGALTAWLMAQAGRLGLPDKMAEVVVGLVGALVLRRVEEWKRSRVASAATAASLLASEPPGHGRPPIPLAEAKR